MADTLSRSYRNTAPGVLAAESAAARARRNGVTPARVATGEHAPLADSLAAPPEVVRERDEPFIADTRPPPTLKGAVRVEAFPEKCKYPYPEISRDGGVWRIDPAEFKVTPAAITQSAPKWAQRHGLTAKTVVDDGMVYVQFKRGGE